MAQATCVTCKQKAHSPRQSSPHCVSWAGTHGFNSKHCLKFGDKFRRSESQIKYHSRSFSIVARPSTVSIFNEVLFR